MRVSLRAFTAEDVPFLQQSALNGVAENFMSRWSPRSFTRGSWPDDLTRWHMIVSGNHDLGTIWMERDAACSHACDLGILIFDPAYRGLGYGSQAIFLAEQDVVAIWGVKLIRLRVRASNQRAISCYQRCGYRIAMTTYRQIRETTVEVHEMEHRMISPTSPI
jgi:ribosomal protein S18 acetylase RimI-like enzyme